MTRSILVVDDDRAIAAVLADLLIEEGIDAQFVCSGQDALDRVAGTPPDLIITDVSMPEISGIELVRRLRERGDHVPVVLMSGVITGIELPGVRFVSKPFDFQRLLEVIEQSWAPPPA
jgi:CheY-like chemotaxis protein